MLENPARSARRSDTNDHYSVPDIRGSRESRNTGPEKIVQLLNRYFSAMTDIIFAHGGTLDKYLGED